MAKASISSVLGLFSLVISMILNVVAISTEHWIHLPNFDIGLMRHCNLIENSCEDNFGSTFETYAAPDKLNIYRFVQVSFSLSCLGCLVCISIAILILTQFLDLSIAQKFLSTLDVLVFLVEVLSVVLFGEMGKDIFPHEKANLSWSFSVAVAGCLFMGLTAFFHIAETVKARDKVERARRMITVWLTPYTLFPDQDMEEAKSGSRDVYKFCTVSSEPALQVQSVS